jgi:hypothetical protein
MDVSHILHVTCTALVQQVCKRNVHHLKQNTKNNHIGVHYLCYDYVPFVLRIPSFELLGFKRVPAVQSNIQAYLTIRSQSKATKHEVIRI